VCRACGICWLDLDDTFPPTEYTHYPSWTDADIAEFKVCSAHTHAAEECLASVGLLREIAS
jgi:hypothetical protein